MKDKSVEEIFDVLCVFAICTDKAAEDTASRKARQLTLEDNAPALDYGLLAQNVIWAVQAEGMVIPTLSTTPAMSEPTPPIESYMKAPYCKLAIIPIDLWRKILLAEQNVIIYERQKCWKQMVCACGLLSQITS